jgi:hypothetical protein
MATLAPISVLQGNDVLVDLAVLEDDGKTPQNITALTPSLLVKPQSTSPDTAATATLTVGSGLTVTDAAEGLLTAFLPRALLSTAGTEWYRLDLADNGGDRTTALYGLLVINPV